MTSPLSELLAIGLCCPHCRDDLIEQEEALLCAGCRMTYPVILGIPDLRVFPDPYIGIEEDRAKGRLLAAYGEGRHWEDLASRYYEITRDTVPAAQARRFAAGLSAALPRAAAALDSWEAMTNEPLRSADRLLDVGCGTAPLLVATGPRAAVKVGVDIAFRWLVVGKLRLADAGVRAHLVCACAEALPFRDGAFDAYVTQGTLENVRNQATTIAESRRVLRDDGKLWISTANRSSLGPDPHLGLPAGGLLPDRIAAAWARSHGALPPQRHLLTRRALGVLLERERFTKCLFGVPALPVAQRAGWPVVLRAAANLYEASRRIPVFARALQSVGPTLLVTARK
jgi:SAM-dependent methyltransferase